MGKKNLFPPPLEKRIPSGKILKGPWEGFCPLKFWAKKSKKIFKEFYELAKQKLPKLGPVIAPKRKKKRRFLSPNPSVRKKIKKLRFSLVFFVSTPFQAITICLLLALLKEKVKLKISKTPLEKKKIIFFPPPV